MYHRYRIGSHPEPALDVDLLGLDPDSFVRVNGYAVPSGFFLPRGFTCGHYLVHIDYCSPVTVTAVSRVCLPSIVEHKVVLITTDYWVCLNAYTFDKSTSR